MPVVVVVVVSGLLRGAVQVVQCSSRAKEKGVKVRVVGRRRDKELVRCVDAGRGVVVVVVVSGLLRGAVQVLQCCSRAK